jgi:hypothetical protein
VSATASDRNDGRGIDRSLEGCPHIVEQETDLDRKRQLAADRLAVTSSSVRP